MTSSSKAPEVIFILISPTEVKMLIYNFQMGGDQKLLDKGNKKMINVPIKIETQEDNNLGSNTSISASPSHHRKEKVKHCVMVHMKLIRIKIS